MEDRFNFYVLTDTHYLSKRLWEEGEPINSRERGDQIAIKCTPEILASFFDKILADGDTNTVLITGDLVNNGDKISHDDFKAALKRLTDAGKRVFVTTATHDYNGFDTPGDENFFRATYYGKNQTEEAEHISRAELTHLYDEYGPNQADSVDMSSGSYSVLLQKGCRLIALNDNGNGRSHCGLFEDGFLWLENEIDKANEKNEIVILAVHHPVLPPWQIYKNVAEFEMFGGYERLKKLMCEKNIRVIFTGHTHVQGIKKYESDDGQYFYDITTSSLAGASGKMRKVSVDIAGRKCKVQGIALDTIRGIDTQGRSAHDYIYSLNFTGRMQEGFGYLYSDYERFVQLASAVLPQKILTEHKIVLKPALKILNKTKMSTVAKIGRAKKKTGLSQADYETLRQVKLMSVVFTVCERIFAGNAPFTPDTAVYKTLSPIIDYAEKILKIAKVDLSKALKDGLTLHMAADSFLYNNRTGDDDNIEIDL